MYKILLLTYVFCTILYKVVIECIDTLPIIVLVNFSKIYIKLVDHLEVNLMLFAIQNFQVA